MIDELNAQHFKQQLVTHANLSLLLSSNKIYQQGFQLSNDINGLLEKLSKIDK
jgi:hypothetical protein